MSAEAIIATLMVIAKAPYGRPRSTITTRRPQHMGVPGCRALILMYRGAYSPWSVYCACIVVYSKCSVMYLEMYGDMLAPQCSAM